MRLSLWITQPWDDTPARVWLHVDSPLLGAQVEGLQRAGLAKQLNAVRVLIATVVARARLPLAVLVCEARSQGLDDRLACEVLAGNELDTLPAMLHCLYPLLTAFMLCQGRATPGRQYSNA